jgi:antitoxin YefM
MKTITISQAESSLRAVIRQIIKDVEPTIVTTETGDSIVMLSLDEYNTWQETRYLLSTPANAEQLMKSIAEDEAGHSSEYQDETAYLLNNEANRKRLLQAVESVKKRG